MMINAFDEKVDYLRKAQEEVAKRDKLTEELDEMKSNQKKLEKGISSEEKSISDEIANIIKKRKQELESSFDKRINDTLTRKRKVSNKRDKEKTDLINNRIVEETKDVKREISDLQNVMKTLFKQHRVPSLCTKRIFYILFMPKGIKERLLNVFSILIGFFIIPITIFLLGKYCFLVDKDINFSFWITLIIASYIIVEMLVYFAISSATKTKNYEVLQRGRIIQNKINNNNKRMKAIIHSITKDKDESHYDLNTYDNKLMKLSDEASEISEEKLKALKGFTEETEPLIIDEVNNRRLGAVEAMKNEKVKLDDKISSYEELNSEQEIFISKTYVPYLGEEFCRFDKLEILISIMEEGAAATVSEAIAAYKGKLSK